MIKILRAFSLLLLVHSHALVAATDAPAAELLMFESKLCEWCEKWREEIGSVYPKTEEGKIAPLRMIDIHRPRPPAYASVNGVVYTPTFVLWQDGREVGRIVGYAGEAFFWGLLGELIDDLRAGQFRPPSPAEPPTAPVAGTPVPTDDGPKR